MGLHQQKCVHLHAGICQNSPPQVPTRGHQKSQDAPHHWNQPIYGTKTQYADTNTAELVDAHSKMYVQKVSGAFLYYTISVNQTTLVALNTTATAHHG